MEPAAPIAGVRPASAESEPPSTRGPYQARDADCVSLFSRARKACPVRMSPWVAAAIAPGRRRGHHSRRMSRHGRSCSSVSKNVSQSPSRIESPSTSRHSSLSIVQHGEGAASRRLVYRSSQALIVSGRWLRSRPRPPSARGWTATRRTPVHNGRAARTPRRARRRARRVTPANSIASSTSTSPHPVERDLSPTSDLPLRAQLAEECRCEAGRRFELFTGGR